MDRRSKYVLLIILFILFANAVIIDILFFSRPPPQPSISVSAPPRIITSTPIPEPSNTPIPSIAITTAPASVPVSTPISVPTPTPELREYFIPLGQGSGSYLDWTVVPGIGAKINLANYGNIEKVYFEATVRIPTGNQTVYVRLYNANSFQSISGSDLTLSGGTSTLLTSQPITLTDGENLYQVQLKTQLQYPTYIDQARIRIVSR